MKHVVVGTAGHIDHGKTALVKALTGIDTDRLPEEKARGITIDLGFAYLEEPDGLTIEIVDVPGHERFVKNMLAGVGGIDLALLVIAADEGVMPQTREHLAICNLLHIKAGLVALTKRDLAEEEWIDRVFTVKGFGTVVTGTLTAGRLALDDRVEIYPKGAQAKVRGLQCHGHPVEQAIAGQRTAVNLQGVERAAIERGDVLGLPGALVPSFLVDATLELLKDAPRPLKARERVRFHAGTSEGMARVLPVDRPVLEPGETTYGRFRLEGPIVALPGDRYVIRSYSPIITIGGGTLLDVAPPRFKRKAPALLAHLQILERGTPEEALEEHLRQSGPLGLKTADLRARTPFGPEKLKELLESLATSGKIVAVDREWFVHGEARQRLREQVLRVLEVFHPHNPLPSGMSREELRTRAGGAEERLFAHMLGALESEGLVKAEKDKVRLASHEIPLSPP